MTEPGTDRRSKSPSSDTHRAAARLFLGLCLSVLIHVLSSVAIYQTAPPPEVAEKPVVLEWIEPSDLDDRQWLDPTRQVVRHADVPPEQLALDDLKVKRRFLSEQRQTVKEEMRAAKSGMTANRSGRDDTETDAVPNQPRTIPTEKFAPKLTRTIESLLESDADEGLGDVVVGKRKAERTQESRELFLPSDPRRLGGLSTSGEMLPPDMQVGEFTALNTDRFRYYSYYARIEELIRFRWVKYVKAAVYGGDVAADRKEYLTKLEIVLDRTGEFVRAIVHEQSGSTSLDTAPIRAFREARRIPHPPREMVKDDGTIRLMYAFHVDQIPSILSRAPTSD